MILYHIQAYIVNTSGAQRCDWGGFRRSTELVPWRVNGTTRVPDDHNFGRNKFRATPRLPIVRRRHYRDAMQDDVNSPPIDGPHDGLEESAAQTGLPAWGVAELPEPLPYSLRNVFRTIGPGAILLAASVGGGEWLAGPAIAVQHGVGILWIATIGIVLQLLFNLEAIRYTLYTGEPILSGILRLKPGSRFWAPIYVALTIAQLGLPALAAACATMLFAAFTGHMPGASDSGALAYVTYGVMAFVLLLLLFGGTIERMLEYVSWAMIAYIFTFLITVNIAFVPFDHSLQTAGGFFQFGHLAPDVNLLLLATLATTAGSGGIGNLAITNWIRDKGMGMGSTVGAISSAVGSGHMQLSHVGNVFPVTSENLRRWRLWWKYVTADQVWLWGLGCFVGMFLNVNLATAIIPSGTDLDKVGAGAFQAQYMRDHLWSGLWFLGLLNGFWILLSTHLGNTDVLVRVVTDTLWTASRRVRRWRGGNISLLYYGLLLVFTAGGLIAVRFGTAMQLFKVLGTVAGLVLAVAALQVLRVNTTLLPAELRPPLWRRAALVLCALFYGTLCTVVVWDQVQQAMKN